jgi:hypothetical protein
MPRPLPRPPVIKSVVDLAIKALCPNPNVSITLPPKITFSCR